jgi:hypothetical protein
MRFPVAAAAAVGSAAAAAGYRRLHREDDLAAEVAVVTGASRGLGLLIATELARRGCRLLLCARDGAELDRADARLRATGAEIAAVACDLTHEEAVEQLGDRRQADIQEGGGDPGREIANVQQAEAAEQLSGPPGQVTVTEREAVPDRRASDAEFGQPALLVGKQVGYCAGRHVRGGTGSGVRHHAGGGDPDRQRQLVAQGSDPDR